MNGFLFFHMRIHNFMSEWKKTGKNFKIFSHQVDFLFFQFLFNLFGKEREINFPFASSLFRYPQQRGTSQAKSRDWKLLMSLPHNWQEPHYMCIAQKVKWRAELGLEQQHSDMGLGGKNHVSSKNPSTWTITFCLLACALAGSWNWKRSWALSRAFWYDILTSKANASPLISPLYLSFLLLLFK